jgi:SAM-dependent methyltransferase
LQLRRLVHALKLARQTPDPRTILDFGAGNGELCKLLRPSYPSTEIYYYEPASNLMEEARRNVGTQFRVDFLSDLNTVKSGSIDLVFCLEVFEHLPLKETIAALDAMARMLSAGGHLIIGVPVEIGFPALYKGLFRMWRRYGAFDANWRNVWNCVAHRPPKRPLSKIAGLDYYFHHTGFDYRHLRSVLVERLDIKAASAAPFPIFGAAVNPEIYFWLRHVSGQSAARP